MRGYLHGGVIIDLIGQKGPTSKIHLVCLDLLVLGLQCFMLAVNVEKERLSVVSKGALYPVSIDGDQPRAEVTTSQDHDAEERGIIRDDVQDVENGSIELQPLQARNGDGPSASGNEVDEDRNEERERLLAEPPPRREEEEEDALDSFWSGTAILAEFHILHNLRRQWSDYGSATESALQTVGFSVRPLDH